MKKSLIALLALAAAGLAMASAAPPANPSEMPLATQSVSVFEVAHAGVADVAALPGDLALSAHVATSQLPRMDLMQLKWQGREPKRVPLVASAWQPGDDHPAARGKGKGTGKKPPKYVERG